MAIAARRLTLTEFGDLALLLTLNALFYVFSDAGYSALLADHTARKGKIERGAVMATLRRRAAGSCLSSALVIGAYALTASDHSVVIPLLFVGAIFGNAFHSSFSAALRATGRVMPEAANETLSRVFLLAAGASTLAAGGGLRGVAIVYSVTELGSTCILAAIIARAAGPHVPTTEEAPIDLSPRRAIPLAVGGAVSTIYARIDAWILSLVRSATALGLYAAAYKLFEAALLPVMAIGALIFTHTGQLSGSALRRTVRRLELSAVAISVLGAVIGVACAPWALSTMFGPEFRGAANALRVLLLSGIPTAVVAVASPLVAVRRPRQFVSFSVVALIGNLALNALLVPLYGATGTATANLASQSVLAVLLHRELHFVCAHAGRDRTSGVDHGGP